MTKILNIFIFLIYFEILHFLSQNYKVQSTLRLCRALLLVFKLGNYNFQLSRSNLRV